MAAQGDRRMMTVDAATVFVMTRSPEIETVRVLLKTGAPCRSVPRPHVTVSSWGKPRRRRFHGNHQEARMATFIVLKRPGPPAREVLVNLDEILMVQPGQGTGSAILFGREHLVPFEEDFATVIRRIQTGPFIQPGQPPTPK
jgi:hypothetical protein